MQQRCTMRRSFRNLAIFLGSSGSVEVHYNPSWYFFQLWYLDDSIVLVITKTTLLNDGTFVGSRVAVADLLSTHGPSFGLSLSIKKCEVFWDQSFPTFLPEISCPLQFSDGNELMGSPISDSTNFFWQIYCFSFWQSPMFTKFTVEDTQVELQLCVNV